MDQINPVSKIFENIKSREKVEAVRARMAPADSPAAAAKNRPAAETGQIVRRDAQPAPQQSLPEQPEVEYDPFQGTYVVPDPGKAKKKHNVTTDPRKMQLEQFAHTLANEIYEKFEKDEERQSQLSRGVREKVAVIFADIRHFTYLTSILPPDRVYKMLNIFHSEMIRVLRDEHGAYIDKLIGDCIMAYFGIPYSADSSSRAVRAALAMQARMAKVNEMLESNGLPAVGIGIGINTGIVHAGFITTDKSISGFTIIGEAVNIAAHLENIAAAGEIVVGESTRNEIIDQFTATEHPEKIVLKAGEGRVVEYSGFLLKTPGEI